MNRARTLTGWALVALLAWPWAPATKGSGTFDAPPAGPAATGPVTRWLGPIAALAASFEWVRWTNALGGGELARAHTHAARALALDPASPEGWLALAQHFVFDRSAAEVEPDRDRRTEFARAGLDVLRQGEARSRDAAALALIGGDLAMFLAERVQPPRAAPGPSSSEAPVERDPVESDPVERDPNAGGGDLDWPGGANALWEEARASYTRALELGHPDAAERLARLDSLR